MLTIAYVEINAFALIVLLTVYFNIRRQINKFYIEQRLFFWLMGVNAMILLLDTGMWVLDGKQGLLLRGVFLAVTALYYFLNPVLCMFWALYVHYQIKKDEQNLKKLVYIMLFPILICALFSVLSIFGDYFFYIDQVNLYHRGRLYYLMAAISYLFLVYAFVLTILNKKKIPRGQFISILLFPIPPAIGSVIQSLFFGVSLIWVCTTISILILFINVQNGQLYTDPLTGLFNRRQLDRFVSANNKEEKKMLAGIMMDLDNFKRINDEYGHQTGDLALECTAKILRDSFRKDDFIARYGGDEFVAIIKLENSSDLIWLVDRLNKNLERLNKQKILPFNISLSMGYDFFDYKPGVSIQEFFRHIDNLMYEDKARKK